MKFSTLALLLLMQALFVAYGVGVTFWTMNEWLADERLNSIFIGFLGSLFFMMAWRISRRWVRVRLGLGNGR